MTEQNLLEELRLADPAPVDAERPEGVWTSAVVLRQLEQRRRTMQTIKDKPDTSELTVRPKRTRKLLAAAAAVVVAIVAAGVIIATVGGSGGSDVASAEDVTVTFDGTSCNYQGPAEFPLNARVNWTFINETADPEWKLEINAVPEGTTAEEIMERGVIDLMVADRGDLSGAIGGISFPTLQNSPETITRSLTIPGQHAVVCVDRERTTELASLFRVADN